MRMMKLALSLAVAGLLVACGKDDPAKGLSGSGPEAAIHASVASLKSGDVKALLASTLPPEHLDRLRSEWKVKMTKDEVSDEERAEYAENISKLVGPEAETELMGQLEPMLVKYETEFAPQMPIYVGMGRGMAMSSIRNSADLSDTEKKMAEQSLEALIKWVQAMPIADRDKARAAIAEICNTARSLKLETIDQVRELEFDQALEKSSMAFVALKKILHSYGLSLDEALDTVKTEVIKADGDNATVRISYEFFKTPISVDAEMVKMADRWYGKDTIEQLNKAIEEESQTSDDSDSSEG